MTRVGFIWIGLHFFLGQLTVTCVYTTRFLWLCVWRPLVQSLHGYLQGNYRVPVVGSSTQICSVDTGYLQGSCSVPVVDSSTWMCSVVTVACLRYYNTVTTGVLAGQLQCTLGIVANRCVVYILWPVCGSITKSVHGFLQGSCSVPVVGSSAQM